MGTLSVRSIPRILFDEFSTQHGGDGQEFLLREGGKETYIRPLQSHGIALAFRDFADKQETGAYVKVLSRIPRNDRDLENRHPTEGIRILGIIQARQNGNTGVLSFHNQAPVDLLEPSTKLLLDMIARAQNLATPFQHILVREPITA